MHAFWAEGFPPPVSAGAALLVWPFRQLLQVVAHYQLFVEPPPPLVVIPLLPLFLALAGGVFVGRRDRLLLALTIAPVVAGVAVAAAGVLPFRHRVALYAVPVVFLLTGAALQQIAELPGRWGRRVSYTLATVVVLPLTPIVAFMVLPLPSQDSRYVLERVTAEMEAGDALFVSCRAEHAVAFYGPRLGIEEWTVGSCDPEDTNEDLVAEILALRRHPRVWFFIYPVDRRQGAADAGAFRLLRSGRHCDR